MSDRQTFGVKQFRIACRTAYIRLFVISALFVLSSCLWGQEPQKNSPDLARLFDSRTRQAVERGLETLASRQHANGMFGNNETRGNPGIVGLAGMAFLSAGNTPTRGKFSANVDRCLQFVLDNTQESGYIVHHLSGTNGPMYGHGFATLFLAEVYGMAPRSDVRDKLSKAVQLIVSTQNSEGGWRYFPERKDADISVTVCQLMALRSARNAGLYVPNETVDRCVEYVKRAQNPDGGFSYTLGPPRDSMFPRSAAGVVAFYCAGIYDSEEITNGLKFLRSNRPRGDGFAREQYYYYGHYYAIQAMWLRGGDAWVPWYVNVRDEVLARQSPTGGWPDPIGEDYGTAMACLILHTPNSYLPIFQR